MNAVAYCLMQGLAVAGASRPALLSAEESLSYGELVARVAKFAAALRERGIGPGERVAMVMLDTPDIVALHQAVMATGAVAVALSNRANAEELGQMLAIVRPHTLVFDGEFADTVGKAVAAGSPTTRLVSREQELRAWKQRSETEPMILPRNPDDPAFWVMTSGTTGTPRAVEHRHANVRICGAYYARVLGTTTADRLFATSRFHFAYQIGNVFAGLRLGATNVLHAHWATANAVAATVERFRPTILLSVPALYHKMLDSGLAESAPLRAVRHYVSAGERLPRNIWTDWEAASGLPILDALGCSEIVYKAIGNAPSTRRPGSSGVAMPEASLRIVDEHGAVISEPERIGRLEVKIPSVCAGYREAGGDLASAPQRPAERFKADGWFSTGDEYARDADGFYHHRGRSGDMLRVSGIWVAPSEIEDVLAGADGIAEAAAVLGENAIGLSEIVLFIVPRSDDAAEASVATARARLAEVLPHYKMPRRFELIGELPRTATGKVQRHKLRERLRGQS